MTKPITLEDNDNQWDSEEGHFYHTISAFEDLIEEYGFDQIMGNVSDEAYIEMFDFFVPVVDGEDD